MNSCKNTSAEAETLLIVDDDQPFLRLLSRAMAKRGYAVTSASSLLQSLEILKNFQPEFAVIDLRLDDGSGLDIVGYLQLHSPHTTVIILSGYANLPNTVAAIKAGAIDCLPKPADADEIDCALRAAKSGRTEMPDQFMQPGEARMQHILARWEKNDRNTTKTADELGLHRRSLQRMLNNAGVARTEDSVPKPAAMVNRFRRLYRVWSRGLG